MGLVFVLISVEILLGSINMKVNILFIVVFFSFLFFVLLKFNYSLNYSNFIAVYDVAWASDDSFAASTKNNILFYTIKQENPIKTLTGHEGPVKCLAYDSSKTYLASGSSDYTVKVFHHHHHHHHRHRHHYFIRILV
jgi:WD40 repeat protein